MERTGSERSVANAPGDGRARSHHAWTLSDGHAGNVRQATALARAMNVPVERDVVLEAGALARLLSPRRWPGADTAFGPDFARLLASPPPLAIGCGRQAALATRLLHARGQRALAPAADRQRRR